MQVVAVAAVASGLRTTPRRRQAASRTSAQEAALRARAAPAVEHGHDPAVGELEAGDVEGAGAGMQAGPAAVAVDPAAAKLPKLRTAPTGLPRWLRAARWIAGSRSLQATSMAQLVSTGGVKEAVAPLLARTGVLTRQAALPLACQGSTTMPRAASVCRQAAPPIR